MSSFKVTNTTNSRSNTLTNTFAPGNTVVTGYKQAGSNIIFASLLDSTIESTTTGYKSSGTDIGNSFCAIYNDASGPGSGVINVSNYSKCTIVMIGGGGGGGGGQSSPFLNPKTSGNGGDGGITIIQQVNISSLTTIPYSVGSAGNGGQGENSILQIAANKGNSGNATTVTISGTTYSANGGGGGPTSPGAGNGTDGTISPATQSVTTATLNGPLTYNATNRVINISSTNYGQGGAGGKSSANQLITGNDGSAGAAGYLRVYLYP